MTKITIITVTYNAEKTFARTAESVLAQTYPCVEHIIVDGASTDGTLSMAQDYMHRSYASGGGHDVRIVSEPDNGIYDAMNKGLRYATGDYVVFLNAGDSLHAAGTLQAVAAAARSDGAPPAVLYGDTDIVDGGGVFLRHRRLAPPREGLTWRSFRHGMLVCHQAFYALRDIAAATPFDCAYRFSADVDWCIRVMREAARRGLAIRYVGTVTADYANEGATSVHHLASLWERFRVMRHHYGTATAVAMHCWFVLRALVKP